MSLDDWQDAWEKAVPQERGSGGEEPPDGRYDVFVEKIELRTSQAGNDYLSWQLRIVDGQPCAGRCLFHRNMLLGAESLSWLKRDLDTCGIELLKLSDLMNRKTLEKFLDLDLHVQKVTKGEFANIYLEEGPGTRQDAPGSTKARPVPEVRQKPESQPVSNGRGQDIVRRSWRTPPQTDDVQSEDLDDPLPF